MAGLIGSMLVVDIARITLTDFLASLVLAAGPYDLWEMLVRLVKAGTAHVPPLYETGWRVDVVQPSAQASLPRAVLGLVALAFPALLDLSSGLMTSWSRPWLSPDLSNPSPWPYDLMTLPK